MLYNEFIEGTGCKDNEYNYKLYKALEHIYMADECNCSKQDIYEMGKKLADNRKSEAELKVEAEVKGQIEEHKAEIATHKRWIEDNERMLAYWKEQGDKEMMAFYRNPIKHWKQEIRYHRNQIAALKWVLGK